MNKNYVFNLIKLDLLGLPLLLHCKTLFQFM